MDNELNAGLHVAICILFFRKQAIRWRHGWRAIIWTDVTVFYIIKSKSTHDQYMQSTRGYAM